MKKRGQLSAAERRVMQALRAEGVPTEEFTSAMRRRFVKNGWIYDADDYDPEGRAYYVSDRAPT